MIEYIFKGVYSLKPKAGMLALKKVYYLAWQSAEGYAVQKFDLKMRQGDEPGLVRRAEFAAMFLHEPGIKYVPDKNEARILSGRRISDFTPPVEGPAVKLDKAERAGAKGGGVDPLLSDGDLAAIMAEYKSAAVKDKTGENLRSRFSNAIKNVGDPRKRRSAMGSLKMLIESDEGIQPAHKHMFNDFGITLRKSKLFDLSLECYAKIIRLSPTDENAYFNAARVLYDSGKPGEAEKYLNEALRVRPDFPYAADFLKFIKNGGNRKNSWPR